MLGLLVFLVFERESEVKRSPEESRIHIIVIWLISLKKWTNSFPVSSIKEIYDFIRNTFWRSYSISPYINLEILSTYSASVGVSSEFCDTYKRSKYLRDIFLLSHNHSISTQFAWEMRFDAFVYIESYINKSRLSSWYFYHNLLDNSLKVFWIWASIFCWLSRSGSLR